MSVSLSYGDGDEAKQQLPLPPSVHQNGLQLDGQGCCSPERQELGRGIERDKTIIVSCEVKVFMGKGECLGKIKLRVHIQEGEKGEEGGGGGEEDEEEEEEEAGRESEMHTQKAELVRYLYQPLSPI